MEEAISKKFILIVTRTGINKIEMQKSYFTVILSLLLSLCYGQPDTIIKKKQKGFLFLSAFNGQYDEYGGHMRPIGFHDFFYPCNDINIELFFRDTIFSGGVRVDFVVGRYGLKKNALKIYGKDTSWCYGYDSFYVVPVIVDFKEFEDYWPFLCQRNFYEIASKQGGKIRFEYIHQAADITRLTELPIKK